MLPRRLSHSVLPTPELLAALDDYMLVVYRATPLSDSPATLGAEISYAISAAIREHLTIQALAARHEELSRECNEVDNPECSQGLKADGSDEIVPF